MRKWYERPFVGKPKVLANFLYVLMMIAITIALLMVLILVLQLLPFLPVIIPMIPGSILLIPFYPFIGYCLCRCCCVALCRKKKPFLKRGGG